MTDASKIRFLSGILGVLIALGVFGYFANIEINNVPKIIVIQDKPQQWADALKLGMHDGLRDKGLEEGVDFVVVPKSAAGDPQGLTGLAEAVARQNMSVIYTLGTQSTQAIFHAAKGKSIVFGAVTDPVKAGFFNGDLTKPIGQITGTQDLWPYPAQFDLITKLLPKISKLGIIYNASEINSKVSVDHITKEAKKRNISVVAKTVIDESQVSAATAGLLNSGIDALFIPADNTAQTSAVTIIAACNREKVPVFTGIPGIVKNGAIGTVGTNYYELGKVNGSQIGDIISGTPTNKIPVIIAEKGDLYLNLNAAKLLGITIPDELVARALKVYK